MQMEGTVSESCTLHHAGAGAGGLMHHLSPLKSVVRQGRMWEQGLTDYPAWSWAIAGDGHRALLTEGKLSPGRPGEPSEFCHYLLGSGRLLWAVN